MGLSNDKIRELYANKRTKGLYEARLTELIEESDEPAVDPSETWEMDFGTKNATTMYQGFRNAAEKLGVADKIDVVQREGSVFLLHKERCALALSDEEVDNTDDSDETEDSTPALAAVAS